MTHDVNKTALRLQAGLSYLRQHTIAAHSSGDGMKVLHLCAIALEKVATIGRHSSSPKLDLKDVRWAFVLGMYWMVQDWFLYRVASTIELLNTEDENATDNEIIVCIHNQLSEPFGETSSLKTIKPSEKWWAERCGANKQLLDEDQIALTLAVELNWYLDPNGDTWKAVISEWLLNCPDNSPLNDRLKGLQGRLNFQSGVFTGRAFKEPAATPIPITDPIQLDLFRGWIAYHNCEWKQLDDVIASLRYRVSVDHVAFVPLFYLLHPSRIHRIGKAEDQFLSLPRMLFARSRQPAHMFQYIRQLYGDEQFGDLAVSGFPPDAKVSERKACMRMATLICLQSLREWNIGAWRIGMVLRAQSMLELSLCGFPTLVMQALVDSVRAHCVHDLQKTPRLLHAVRMIDFVDESQRVTFLRILLESPRIEWRHVYNIICEIGDAIPEQMFPELAEWTLQSEEGDLVHDLWIGTLFGVWNQILPRASNNSRLIAQLAPVLRRLIIKPQNWRDLESSFIASLVHSDMDIATELTELLVSASCEADIFNSMRFSIVYNAMVSRPKLRNVLLPFASEDAGRRKSPYQIKLVDNLRLTDPVEREKSDIAYRKELTDRLLERISARANLTGPSYAMGGPDFFRQSEIVKWHEPVPELIEAIRGAIDSPSVLLSDKDDYLAFLARIVQSGPISQSEDIAKWSIEWLINGIPGKSLGLQAGGPLSSIQVQGSGEELRHAMLFLVQECSLHSPRPIQPILCDWLPANAFAYADVSPFHLLKLLYATIRAAATVSEDIPTVLSGLAAAVTMKALESRPTHVVGAIHEIVLDECVHEFEQYAALRKPWMIGILNHSIIVFTLLAKSLDPEVRRCVAAAVLRWQKTNLPQPPELLILSQIFSTDSRMRVRKPEQAIREE